MKNKETKEKFPSLRTLTDKEKFCLDAYISNGNLDMAWMLSRERPTSSTKPDIIRRMALRWMRDKAVMRYVEEQRKITLSDCPDYSEKGGANDFRNKDYIINEYVKLIQITTDPKLRAELLWRVSEIQNMRKQEEGFINTTHYYLPLSCRQCSLYRERNKSKKDDNGEA